ncbi:NAD(P)/FAD-dependent oxidoreductase [Trebonia sp.]|uniref:NAD(P)/FAD-dependent oxidoreductase n=1 Tax=Trebonia sp. TaxID=2767075 RepID=UPI002638B581|nr:NAD(P)/FAD-dependent oxidoreductase [Trebonia sp.]
MTSEQPEPDGRTGAPRVVIVGAGFAGLSAVGALRKAHVHVTIIDRNLYSTFQPLLYQVATGGLNPGDVSYAVGGFTARRHTRYIRGDLAAIDQAAQRIRLTDGRDLGYDYLILASGVSAAYYGVKGAAENTFGLYTRVDAIVLRDHIMNGYEQLSAGTDPGREFAITVVGGGATGVELAGTLGELRSDVLRATFSDVDPARVHVRLVEMAPELLMPFKPRLREYARRQLAARGVDILLNTKILRVQPDSVVLGDGSSHHSDLTVWAAGVAGPEAVAGWNLPQGPGGRILVGPDLRVQGSDRIFAAGDIAVSADDPSPQLAQPALQEGRHAARQVIRLTQGGQTQPFRYHDKGMMATIGRRSAVVQLARGARFTGTLAWFAWLGLHLVYLLGYRNRISTLINLSWRYLAWGHGGGVIVGDEPPEPLPGQAGQGGARQALRSLE